MSAPSKAEELEEFIATINIPLWEVLEVAMANIIEQSGSEAMVAAEVDAVTPLLYHECYVGGLRDGAVAEARCVLRALCAFPYCRSCCGACISVGTLALQRQRNDAML